MTSDLVETLSLAQRLALSYTSAQARGANLALLALDQRLQAILTGGGEPMIAQIKLAWWRDRLGEFPAHWPEGEPLLALLREFPGGTGALTGIVDGWEVLLAERIDPAGIAQFAEGRAQGWRALAQGDDAAEQVARQWALADLLLHLPAGEEADMARACLEREGWSKARLRRPLRPLAVLHGLGKRALQRGTGDLLDGPGAMFTALRVGILGR